MANLETLERVKLTKKYYMKLKEGVFLVSNLGLPTQPFYFEYVKPFSERNKQWKQIALSGAAQRTCSVFKDKKHWESWVSGLNLKIK